MDAKERRGREIETDTETVTETDRNRDRGIQRKTHETLYYLLDVSVFSLLLDTLVIAMQLAHLLCEELALSLLQHRESKTFDIQAGMVM